LNILVFDPLVAPVAVGVRSVLVMVTVLVWCKELEMDEERPSTVYTRTELIVK